MEKRKVEILAPAGSFASMKAAVAAGADAVYMGEAVSEPEPTRRIRTRRDFWRPLTMSTSMDGGCI